MLEIFEEVFAGRQQNGMGPSGLTYRDIESWSVVTGVRLRPWEVEAMMRLSAAWVEVQSERK